MASILIVEDEKATQRSDRLLCRSAGRGGGRPCDAGGQLGIDISLYAPAPCALHTAPDWISLRRQRIQAPFRRRTGVESPGRTKKATSLVNTLDVALVRVLAIRLIRIISVWVFLPNTSGCLGLSFIHDSG